MNLNGTLITGVAQLGDIERHRSCGLATKVNPVISHIIIILDIWNLQGRFSWIAVLQIDTLYRIKFICANRLKRILDNTTAIQWGIERYWYGCGTSKGLIVKFLFTKHKVFTRLRQPCRVNHATRIHVAVSLHGVLLHPFHILGLVQIDDKLSHIAHQDAFKTRQIAVHHLTNMDDTVLVTKMLHGVFHDSLCILLVLFVAIMVVKHDGCAQHGALIVGRGPSIVLGRQIGCRVPDKRIKHLSRRRIE